MQIPDISVVILTLNEELHIRRCIENVKQFTNNIFIVDCFSTDNTIDIVKSLGVTIYTNKWPGLHAIQFNWALENLPVKTKWVLRLDADEYLTPELINEIKSELEKVSDEVNGIILKRRVIFLNKWIKHGVYPVRLLRIFRFGYGHCEQRFMDEHITLTEGKTTEFINDFIDHNLNDIGWWIQKHIGYSNREAIDILNAEKLLLMKPEKSTNNDIGNQAARKRRIKSIYARMPLFFRPFFYFIYRYFFRLGFLDGRKGFLWHFLQGWWYRTLVDVHIWEVKTKCGRDVEKIEQYIEEKYRFNIKEISSYNQNRR